jgi:hypothetical protein
LRRIDRRNLRAHARQRRGDKTAAAAEVEHAEAGQRFRAGYAEMLGGEVAHVLETHRVHAVQGPECAFGIPPLSRQRAELLYLGGVDGGVGHANEIEAKSSAGQAGIAPQRSMVRADP